MRTLNEIIEAVNSGYLSPRAACQEHAKYEVARTLATDEESVARVVRVSDGAVVWREGARLREGMPLYSDAQRAKERLEGPSMKPIARLFRDPNDTHGGHVTLFDEGLSLPAESEVYSAAQLVALQTECDRLRAESDRMFVRFSESARELGRMDVEPLRLRAALAAARGYLKEAGIEAGVRVVEDAMRPGKASDATPSGACDMGFHEDCRVTSPSGLRCPCECHHEGDECVACGHTRRMHDDDGEKCRNRVACHCPRWTDPRVHGER